MTKVTAATAAEICEKFKLPTAASKLLKVGMTPGAFLKALIEKQQFVTAIDFMAYALPPRERLWWGCLCMQHAFQGKYAPNELAAARAAVQWIFQPTDESRAAAKVPAETAGPSSPAGCLAMAANLTGSPSIKCVANAVKLSSLKCEPLEIAPTQKSFVALAVEVAEGRYM
jgi:hypothetical protein